ncbi:MAG: hypothetical protein IT258_18120 [Saprospiraceae bacterium]|nr:hypothetical protein [Saprospiraceae bacterium]
MEMTSNKDRPKSLSGRYRAFLEREEKNRTLWFIVPLMVLSAGVMPPTIFLMSYFGGLFLPFVGISILLFFTNITLSIAGQPVRVTIGFFLFTVAFHFVVPLLCFIATQLMGG